MLNLKPTIVVRHEARLAAVIVTVRGQTYGSLEIDKLEQLRADLAAVRDQVRSSDDRVIIDLSGLTMLGSAFLSELFGWLRTLGRTPADVIVCGDQTGLLKLCAVDRWLTVRENLVAAINQLCDHNTPASSQHTNPNLVRGS